MREVYSLTDILLSKTYPDPKLKGLTEAELANQAETVLGYRIAHMTDAMFCYTPNVKTDTNNGLYQLPEIDITEMTSVGVAMAMLIISTLQNELMLDTQLDGIKCTQNQKLGASNTKILETKKAIRKSRYKSPFQIFMEKLNKSGIMKFLNSNYGKVIMFLVGAATTIASFGTAGPAVIAIGSVLLAFQAAELILGKSMGELLTQSMDDGSAKMALQMAIDVAFMAADMVNGMQAAAKAGAKGAEKAAEAAEQVRKAGEVIENAQKTAKQAEQNVEMAQNALKTLKETGEASDDVIKNAEKSIEALDEGTKKFNKIVEEAQNTKKALQEALDSGDAVKMMEESQKLGKQMEEIASQAEELGKKFEEFADFAKNSGIGKLGNLAESSSAVAKSMSDVASKAREVLVTFTAAFDAFLSDPKFLQDYENQLKTGRDKLDAMEAELADAKKADTVDKANVDKLEKAIENQKASNRQLVEQIDLVDAGGSRKLAGDVRRNAQHELQGSTKNVGEAGSKFQDGDLTIAEMQDEMRKGGFKDFEQSLDIRNFEKNQQIKRADLQNQLEESRKRLDSTHKDWDRAIETGGETSELQKKFEKEDALRRKLVDDIDFIDAGYDESQVGKVRQNGIDVAQKYADEGADINVSEIDETLSGDWGDIEGRLKRNDMTIAEIRQGASDSGFDDVAEALDTGSGGYADADFGAYTVHGNFLSSSNRTATGGTRKASQVLSSVATGARAIAGLRGLEHLTIFQQIMIASQRLQNMIQSAMQFYQALYNLAVMEETTRNIKYAAEVDAINTRFQALDEFYQMMLDNQMADIQSLMSYVKASYERAAEAIREYGETNMEIIRNIAV